MAKDHDINLHIRARGVEETEKGIRDVRDGLEDYGDTAAQSGQKAGQASGENERLSGSFDKTGVSIDDTVTKLGAYAAGLLTVSAAIGAIKEAINAQIEAMKESAEIAEEHQRSLLALQYLGDYFKENKDLRKQVAAAAEFGVRPVPEVAEAWYNLRSKAANLTESQRMDILIESLEMGRTDPAVPLNTLVDMSSLYAKLSGQMDANRVQNVLQQTITEAGGSGDDVAKYMPQFLPVGMSGGLTPAQAAGLWAYVTTQVSEPSIATTGLKNVFLGLMGKGTPESQELMAAMGLSEDMHFTDKIGALSQRYQAGQFGLSEAQTLAGEEGASALLAMLKNSQDMQATIQRVEAADRGDIDLTRSKIEGLMGSDEIARLEEDNRRIRVMIENEKNSPEALRKENYLLRRELERRRGGSSEWEIIKEDKIDRALLGTGLYDVETMERQHREYLDLTGQAQPEINVPGPADIRGDNAVGGPMSTIIYNQNVLYMAPEPRARSRFGPEAVV